MSGVETAAKLKECQLVQSGVSKAIAAAEKTASTCTASLDELAKRVQVEDSKAEAAVKARQTAITDLKSKFGIERQANTNLQRERTLAYRTAKGCGMEKKNQHVTTLARIEGFTTRAKILRSTKRTSLLDAVRKAEDVGHQQAAVERQATSDARKAGKDAIESAQLAFEAEVKAVKEELAAKSQATLGEEREKANAKLGRDKAFGERQAMVGKAMEARMQAEATAMNLKVRVREASRLLASAGKAAKAIQAENAAYRAQVAKQLEAAQAP
jgi:hypothetical protein